MLPVLLAFALAASGPGVDVEVWADAAAELEAIETFDWAEPPALGEWSRRQRGALSFEDRIRDVLEAALADRGLRFADGDEAHVLVGFAVLPPDREPVRPTGVRMGRAVQGVSIEIGSRMDDLLVLELLDAVSGLPVWRARAGPVFQRDAELFEALGEAAGAALERLPRTADAAAADGS